MTTLLLVRHGESEANRGGIFAGHYDFALLPKGIEQAEKTAEYIAQNFKPCKVYASDLKRAFKTGQIIADLLKVEIISNKNLREINAGDWQGMKFDDIAAQYSNDFSRWVNDIGNSVCTGGESIKHLAERVLSALTDIAENNSGKTIVVATHATPIRTMQCVMQGFPLGCMKNIPWVSNASVTEVTYENGKWDIIKTGDDKHLSSLITTVPANV